MRKWRLKRPLIGLYVLIFIFFASNSLESNAAKPVEYEIIVLIDMSKSMEDAWEEVKCWATEIGVNFQNMGVKVDLKKFGGKDDKLENIYTGFIGTQYDASGISLKDYAAKIDEPVEYKKYTDQTGALENAIGVLENASASNKCIIMLSDGKLDYEEDETENAAKERFKEKAEKFVEKENQNIVLVQFNSTYNGGIDVFTGLIGVQLLKADADPADILLDKAMQVTLDELDLSGKRIPITVENNHSEFELEKKYNRVILQIESLDNNISENTIKSIVVNKETAQIEPSLYSPMGSVTYLYYDKLEKGTYTVTMPEGNWLRHVLCLGEAEIQEIKLSIIQGSTEIKPNQDGAYELERGTSYKLRIKVDTLKAEQLRDLDSATMKYILIPMKEGNESTSTVCTKESNGIYNFPLDFKDGGNNNLTYQCYVEINHGSATDQSERITIISRATTEHSDSVPIKKTVLVGEAINVQEDFEIPNDTEYTLYFTIGENSVIISSNEKYLEDEYKFEDGTLSFKEKNTYVVSAKITEGDEKKEAKNIYQYEVSKKSWWEKILDFLTGL